MFSIPVFDEDDPIDCELEIIVPEDFHICFDEEFNLNSMIIGDYDDYIWIQNGSEENYDLDEDISIEETTTFTLIAWHLNEENIIENGDFENGDDAFTTDYEPGTMSCYGLGFLDCEGTYAVIDDPSSGHASFASCSDQDGGSNMMVVNGAASLQEIWCQEVCVELGAEYVFGAWATSVNASSPAQLQFSIDGVLIGELFSLDGSLCSWEEFEASWTSDLTGDVEICVTNQNTAASGNDFAIDNISFFKTCMEEASFTVHHSEFEVFLEGPEVLSCTTLSSDALVSVDPIDDYSFEVFYEGIFFEEGEGAELYLEFTESGEYSIIVTDQNDCTQEIEFELETDTEIPHIEASSSNDLDCEQNFSILTADSDTRSVDFLWLDTDENILSDDDEFTVYNPGTYIVQVIDPDNGCVNYDTLVVNQDTSIVAISLDLDGHLSCANPTTEIIVFNASDSIVWTDVQNLTLAINTSTISVDTPGVYFVNTLQDNGCYQTSSIEVLRQESSFDYLITQDSIINCSNPIASIEFELDTSNLSIQWLNAEVDSTTTLLYQLDTSGVYYFVLQDSLGCALMDSIEISEDFESPELVIHVDSLSCLQNYALNYVENSDNNLEIFWVDSRQDTISSDSITVYSEGVWDVLAIAKNGCSTIDSITILSSEEIPQFEINGNDIDCENLTTELSIESDDNILSYNWILPDSTQSDEAEISSTLSGEYFLEITNDKNCTATRSIEINIDTIVPILELPDSLLLNCDQTLITGTANLAPEVIETEFTGTWFDPTDYTYSISEPGEFALTVTSANHCSQSESIMVAIDTIRPHVSLPDTIGLSCYEDQFILSFQKEASYSTHVWEHNGVNSYTDSLTVFDSGYARLTVTGNNGCTSEVQSQIEEDFQNPELNITADTITCALTEATINIGSNSVLDNVWAHSPLTSKTNDYSFSSSEAGIFTFTAVGNNGCETEISTEVQIDTIHPDFSLFAEDLNCIQTSTEILIDTDDQFSSIEIYNPIGEPLTLSDLDNIDFPGSYEVSIELDNGCRTSHSVEVISNNDTPSITHIQTENIICEEAITVNNLDIQGGQIPYTISIDQTEINLDSGLPVMINGEGIHSIIVTDANGCTQDSFVTVEALEPLSVSTEEFLEIEFGDEEKLVLSINKDPERIKSISWLPQEHLSCYDCLNPTFIGTEDQNYTIVVEDIQGCIEEVEIRIAVKSEVKYYVPNVISLSTLSNNKFTIHSASDNISNINYLIIYDRWGNLVFQNNNFEANILDLGWDGYINDQPAVSGVFVYIAELELRNGEVIKIAGDLTLIR